MKAAGPGDLSDCMHDKDFLKKLTHRKGAEETIQEFL